MCMDFKQGSVHAQTLFQKAPSGNNGMAGKPAQVKNQGKSS